MKSKWYRSNFTKAALIVLAHIMVAMTVAIVTWMAAYPTVAMEACRKTPAEEYQDSRAFMEMMGSYSSHAIDGIWAKQLFEKDGQYAPDQLVDIEEFYDNRTFGESGGQTEGETESSGADGRLKYRLGDLIDWYKKGTEDYDGGMEYSTENIIVCQKTDNTYDYYKISEFFDRINSGQLQFIVVGGEEAYSKEQILSDLAQGYGMEGDIFRGVQDEEGKILYSDCWVYGGDSFLERYQPVGADSLLEFVNEDPQWNGRLKDAYSMLESVISFLGAEYEASYENTVPNLKEGNTNFVYMYADMKNRQVHTNRAEFQEYNDFEVSLSELKHMGKYVIVKPEAIDFETNMSVGADQWLSGIKEAVWHDDDFVFAAAVDTDYPIHDLFYTENELFRKYGSGARGLLICAVLSAILFLICVVWLVAVAGRSDKDGRLHLSRFDRWFTEIAAAVIIGMWMIVVLAFVSLPQGIGRLGVYGIGDGYIASTDYVMNVVPYVIGIPILAVVTCTLFLTGLLSLARRIKARSLWRNSLLRKIYLFVKMVFCNMSIIWKTVVAFGVFMLLQLFLFVGWDRGAWIPLFLLGDVAVFVWLIRQAIGKDKIKKGITQIAEGEVDYKIPIEGLKGEQKKIAESINCIGDGLEAAVEKSMRSERLKTDLITNVSHDIKTPLTSIINYVELLKQEDFEDPKIQRYIEVLEQKSQRLKNLTEDVVEASKVSSGSMTLEYVNLNLVEMIQQTSGEFEEKFKKRGLKEVLTLPGEEAIIRADGQRTWRILENIYNNAAKYAMEGTRVYGDLTIGENTVTFNLKNISEQPLNISAEELTERFIRGDISRSTEGSGLGLSIAKSLAEIQGGKFELYLDGDLFKVTLSFPKV